jgi:hypothetical protein
VSGFANEMRKKSHVTVQKWVDSISVTHDTDDTDNVNCDNNNELNVNQEPSTSGGSVKEKFTVICNKLHVNEKIKSKKIEFKNLLTKTSQKLKKENSKELSRQSSHDNSMDVQQQQAQKPDSTENEDENVIDEQLNKEDDKSLVCQIEANDDDENKQGKEVDNVKNLTIQRCHISVLGRSCSENPNPITRARRLTDIGRSFSVANDNELPVNSCENLIYDADEDMSIATPSFHTSPSLLSNKTNSNNQLDNKNLSILRPSLSHMRPLREHTVSEGHYSPQQLPKNPLLRDSSFQVRLKSLNKSCKMILKIFHLQSDSSHCSSVESLLEARKPDAEAILVNLGFGPANGSDDVLSKIPKR